MSNKKFLITERPDLVKEFHPTKNKNVDISTLFVTSDLEIVWQCKNNHEWTTKVRSRASSKTTCPICSGNSVLKGYNDLATIHPEIAAQWHPTKNGNLKSNQITAGSHRKVWWQCDKGHEWEATVGNKTGSSHTGCPFCSGKKILQGFNDLATVNPTLTMEWHPTKNDILPIEVTGNSGKKVWWQCDKGHEWEVKISSRNSSNSTCPFCSNRRTLPDFNDLLSLNPSVAKEWHILKNGKLTPTQITPGSKKKVWWQCEKGHEWEAEIGNRTVRGSNCPSCASTIFASKAEKDISHWLNENNISHLTNIRNIPNIYELDIYIPEKKIAIEYNGLYWHSEAAGKTKTYHYDKWLACKNQGIQLIQIWEDDWNRNPELVKRTLAHKIGVATEDKVYARKTIVKKLTNKEANPFLTTNHIQGAGNGSIRYGLFIENKENQILVAVLVLKTEPGTYGETLNIVRYSTNRIVVGGFTKLLKHVEKIINPEKIITFSDNSISNGKLYKQNGFEADKNLKPDYFYINKAERVHKFNYRLKKFKNDPTLLYDAKLSERELAKLNNIPRIWDAGKIRWVKHCKITKTDTIDKDEKGNNKQ